MSLGASIPPRHTLVWIDPEAWDAELSARPELASEPLVANWAARSWPLVIRRRCAADRAKHIPLGLPLPPSHNKRRVAIDLSTAAVLSVRPALPLAEVSEDAPTVWRRTINAVLDLASDYDIEPRVFGSLAWARLTGLDYVRAGSDLDLLWPLTPHIADLLARLTAIEGAAPGRLDGEVVDEEGAAANWRELIAHPADILVKTLDGVTLVACSRFLRSAEMAT